MEIAIVKFFNRLGKGKVDYITDALSRVRYLFIFWIVVSFLALFFESAQRELLFLSFLVATIAHFMISEGVIKRGLVRIWSVRQRPYLYCPEGIIPVGRKFSDSSFPSSHMASTLAMLTVIIFFHPLAWIWAAATILVLAMAFARLHNGMHYPTDILAGIVLGISYGMLGIYLAQLFL